MRNILALQAVAVDDAAVCRLAEACVSSYSVVSCVSSVSRVGKVS